MSETILVTGGAGFIGSHIVDAFIAAGHDVAIIDNLSTGKRENVSPDARLYVADIRDAEEMDRIFGEVKPTVVAHQAALANVRESLIDPARYAAVNVIGTLNVLEASRKWRVRKLLFASTGGAIYGEPAELPATEDCPAHPLDPYGASKLAGEHCLYLYRHNYGLDYCALRYPNVYGPRQDPHGEAGVIAIFIGKMLQGQTSTINGDGSQRRDFLYVGDVARANVLALQEGSGIYNLGSGTGTDIASLYHQLASLTDCTLPARYGPAKLGEVHTIFLNASRAMQVLKWRPTVTLTQGLANTVTYYQAQDRERMMRSQKRQESLVA